MRPFPPAEHPSSLSLCTSPITTHFKNPFSGQGFIVLRMQTPDIFFCFAGRICSNIEGINEDILALVVLNQFGNQQVRVLTKMPASDEKPWWDPYKTSQKIDFIYRPNSSTQATRPTTTQAFRNPYSLCGPVGSTGYNQDFHCKTVCKPDCIRTGSSSGNRRNNPHPSQYFMVWRLPRGSKHLATGSQSQWKKPPSEEELRNTLSAQYRSTYRTDFLGVPQGYHRNQTILAPLSYRQQAPYSIQTEMMHSYQEPRQKSALQGNICRYGCNPLHEVAPKGIVPTVVHSHICNQENAAQLTSYDRHFGGKTTDVTTVLGALPPQDLQQFYKLLPERDKEVVQTFLCKGTPSSQVKKVTSIPPELSKPEMFSCWPGPL